MYLTKAGLLEKTGRGKFRITERGLQILEENPPNINIKFPRRFPELLNFQNLSKHDNKQVESEKSDESNQTPEETLELSYQTLRRDLAQELLERIKSSSPRLIWIILVKSKLSIIMDCYKHFLNNSHDPLPSPTRNHQAA